MKGWLQKLSSFYKATREIEPGEKQKVAIGSRVNLPDKVKGWTIQQQRDQTGEIRDFTPG